MQGPHWTEAERAARLGGLVARNRAIRSGRFAYEDAAWMRDAYLERKLTLRQMATEAECAVRTIARWMEIHDIPRRPPGLPAKPRQPGSPSRPRLPPKTCEVCGKRVSARHVRRCQGCRDRSGDRNPKWRGGRAEYTAIHGRLIATRGKPSEHACAHCGGPAREWAYDHSDPDEKRNHTGRDDGPYSLDLDRYFPLCVRCHRRFDFGLDPVGPS